MPVRVTVPLPGPFTYSPGRGGSTTWWVLVGWWWRPTYWLVYGTVWCVVWTCVLTYRFTRFLVRSLVLGARVADGRDEQGRHHR